MLTTYCGNHFTLYTYIKLLCCTPKINIMSIIPHFFEKKDLMGFVLPSFGTCLRLIVLLTFLFLPFGMGMSLLYLSYHCILEADNLLGFTDSQLERNSASG